MGLIYKKDLFLRSPMEGIRILDNAFKERNIMHHYEEEYFSPALLDSWDHRISYLSRFFLKNTQTGERFSDLKEVCDYFSIDYIATEYFSNRYSVDWLFNRLQILDALRYVHAYPLLNEYIKGRRSDYWDGYGYGESISEAINNFKKDLSIYKTTGDFAAYRNKLSVYSGVSYSDSDNLYIAQADSSPRYLHIDFHELPEGCNIYIHAEDDESFNNTPEDFKCGYDFISGAEMNLIVKYNREGTYPVFEKKPELYSASLHDYRREFTIKHAYADIRPFMTYYTTPIDS